MTEERDFKSVRKYEITPLLGGEPTYRVDWEDYTRLLSAYERERKHKTEYLTLSINQKLGIEVLEEEIDELKSELEAGREEKNQANKTSVELFDAVKELQIENRALKGEKEKIRECLGFQMDQVKILKAQLEAKDKEIDRLREMAYTTKYTDDGTPYTIAIEELYEVSIDKINELQKENEELKAILDNYRDNVQLINKALHPNGDGPKIPSMCDIVVYVRDDLDKLRKENEELKKLNQTAPS